MNSKIDAYIGFAIKKGSAVFGVDCIEKFSKKMFLIVYTEDISENSLKKLRFLGERSNVNVVAVPQCNSLKNKNCKALAICDQSLANAILANING